MKDKYIFLKEEYYLRQEIGYGIIFCKEFEKILNQYHTIPIEHFAMLSLLDGRFKFDDLVQICMNSLGSDVNRSKKMVRHILDTYSQYIEYKNSPGHIITVFKKNKKVQPSEYKYHSKHRLCSPLVLSLVLTYKCECYCRYCFVNANTEKKCRELSTEEVLCVLKEAADYGVYAVNITGGDPFTRADIFEILECCVENGLNVNISTKVLFGKGQIEKLCQSKLGKIQISLDSWNDEETKFLVAREKYASAMLDVISELVKKGIQVYVNTVVTKINIKNIPELIVRLEQLGVSRHYITPYLRTLGRHEDELFPSKEDYDDLAKFIRNYRGSMDIDYKEPVFEDANHKEELSRCTGGRMGIVINPTGKVTICERLIDTEESIVGNIRGESLMDIWNGKCLHNLIEPSIERYKGTSCYECKDYQECILDKGLCYARCKCLYNQIYCQDPLCPITEENVRFV